MIRSNNITLLLVTFLTLFGGRDAFGQAHRWANFYPNTRNINSSINTSLVDAIDIDADDNVYAVGIFKDTVIFSNSIKRYSQPTSEHPEYGEGFISKQDKNGSVQWVRQIWVENTSNTDRARLKLIDVKTLKNGNITVLGNLWKIGVNNNQPVIKFSATDSLEWNPCAITPTVPQNILFLARYDSSGNLLNYKRLYCGIFDNNQIRNDQLAIDSENNHYILINNTNITWGVVPDVNGSVTLPNGTSIVKYSSNFDTLLWRKNIAPNNLFYTTFKIKMGDDDNLYSVAGIYRERQFIFDGDTLQLEFNDPWTPQGADVLKGHIAVYNKSGNVIHHSLVNQKLSSYDVAIDIYGVDTNNIYVMGYAQDTLKRGAFQASTNFNPANISFFSQNPVPFVAKMSTTSMEWATLARDPTAFLDRFFFNALRTPTGKISVDKNGYAYVYFRNDVPIFDFGGLRDAPTNIRQGSRNALVKLDSIGNALWISRLYSARDIKPNSLQEVAYGGGYVGSFILNPFTSPNNFNNTPNAFIAQFLDYNIVRGNVSSGPYCAGDSIFVPYTKLGVYDTSNFFVAELSDENGEFLGGERELGRIKANEDSTVIGILPLFEVATSNKYRIRIRSTQPAVQSFFREDNFTLLIFSRDKADPGPDKIICSGEEVQLSTFGGTTWNWSPAYRMSNPNVRQPFVFPLVDTTYTIIIGDTSGCGEPDTASLRVFVREIPAITSKGQTDSIVCIEDKVTCWANFSGGDTSQYYLHWYESNGTLIKTTQIDGFSDSLTLTIFQDTSVYVVFTDSCSTRKDSVFFNINLPAAITNVTFPDDVTLCTGEIRNFDIVVNYDKMDSVSITWENVLPNPRQILSSDFSLTLTGGTEFLIETQIINSCVADTLNGMFSVDFLSPLQGNIADKIVLDTFCNADIETWSLEVLGGNPNQYQYNWVVGDSSYNDSLFTVQWQDFYDENNSIQEIFVRLEITDNCSQPIVVDSTTLVLRAPLTIDFIDTNAYDLCYGNEVTLNVLPNGGRIQSREIQWLNNDSIIGIGNQFTFNSQQWYNLTNDTQFVFKALVDDGCSFKDSTTFQIAITRPLTVKINTPSDTVFVCNGQELTLDALVSGGQSDDYILEWWTDEGDTAIVNSFTQIFSKGKTLSDSIQTVNVRLSDGCTAPTVFDRISVVIDKAPLISLKNQSNAYNQIDDTLICWGEIITLNSTVFYADVSNQNPRWYIDGQMQNIDWNFTIPTNVFLNMVNQQFVVQVVWEDECGIFNDTATLVVNVRDSLDWNTTNLFPDTLICYETDLEMSSQLMGGLPSGYQWEWKNMLNNEVLGTDSFLALNILVENIQISLTASDQCSVQEYEYNINIEVRPPLEITLASNTDCANPDAELTATPLGGKMDDYNIEWENTDGQIIGNGTNITVQPFGIQTYKATLTDGCSFSSAEAEITIDQTPIINNFDITPTEGCEPLPIILTYQTDYPNIHNANVQWGDGNQSNFNNLNSENQEFNYQYEIFGEYTSALQISSETGCNSLILNEEITVWPLPLAGFSYSPLEPSLDSNLVNFLNISSGAISYQWDIENMGTFTEENPSVLFSDTGIYEVKLVAFTDRNCQDSTLQQIYIKPNFKIFPPTVFSPNNDGLNDRFRPIATGFESIEITIYNRWGAIVYQSNHNEGWDGTYRGERVPQGAYYYTIRIVSLQKELRFLSGTVTVVY